MFLGARKEPARAFSGLRPKDESVKGGRAGARNCARTGVWKVGSDSQCCKQNPERKPWTLQCGMGRSLVPGEGRV